ncbi:MAG: bifunctional precorrin-2 dehydrogenase/sirohydrochlorin ferrochelatase [Holophaga sp.]|nr:bifunctional precorrin-2 dehydrogenase/sirohydrochlorin ferrochelatase [Holophaga sp.]
MFTPTTYPRLPLFLDLSHSSVLLVGGGRTAQDKLLHLREAGATVHAVALRFSPDFQEAAHRLGQVILHTKPYEPSDLEGVRLVVSATDIPTVNAQVALDAKARNLFVNAVDDPPSCDAYFASQFRRGPWHLAIGTQGGFPGLSRALRETLDILLPAADADLLGDLARSREALLARLPDPAARRQALLALVNSFQTTYLNPEPRP